MKALVERPAATISKALPQPATQAARSLLRLYARLRGELEKAKDGEATLVHADDARRAIHHIASLMPILGVNFEPSALKPVRTHPRVGPLKHGELRAGILAALRASGDWMTYLQMAAAILEKHGITLTLSQHRHFLQKLREAVFALGRKGVLEREKALKPLETKELQRWRLSRKLFRHASKQLPPA